MSLNTKIIDSLGTGNCARVSDFGQLVTSGIKYDQSKFDLINLSDTAFNFYSPVEGHNLVITGITAYGNKNVDKDNGAIVDIYQANSETSTTIDKTILEFVAPQQQSVVLLPLNLIVAEGKFLNVKSSDTDIFMNIMGYNIKKL